MSALAKTLFDLSTDALLPDQRRSPRYLCVDGGVVRLAVRPEFRGRRGLIVDVSVGGIAFLLEAPLELDTVLVFELPAPQPSDAFSRIARVRHLRPHTTPADAPWLRPARSFSRLFRTLFNQKPEPIPAGPAWLIGCEFDRTLTEDELRQFLDRLKSSGQWTVIS